MLRGREARLRALEAVKVLISPPITGYFSPLSIRSVPSPAWSRSQEWLMTSSPRFRWFRIGRRINSTGFWVGWSRLTATLSTFWCPLRSFSVLSLFRRIRPRQQIRWVWHSTAGSYGSAHAPQSLVKRTDLNFDRDPVK